MTGRTQKIYVATCGEYDDYQVIGVFLREEDARDCPLADDYFEDVLRTGPMDVRTRYGIHQVKSGPEKDQLRYRSWEEEYDGDARVKLEGRGAVGWDYDRVLAVMTGAADPFADDVSTE